MNVQVSSLVGVVQYECTGEFPGGGGTHTKLTSFGQQRFINSASGGSRNLTRGRGHMLAIFF